MKRSRCFILLTTVFVISIVFGLGVIVTPVAASTTTYTGNGNERSISEYASNLFSGSVNNASWPFLPTLPGAGWTGYQLGTTFSSIYRNADYVPNGVFTGSASPWTFSSSSSSYLQGRWNSTPPTGTKTGAASLKMLGNTTIPTTLSNMNFTSSSNWAGGVSSKYNSGTFTSAWNSTSGINAWQEKGTYAYTGSSPPYVTSATAWCNQTFSYSGLVPPQLAVLNYQYYSNYWVNMVNGSMTIEVMLTTPSEANYTFGVATYGGINTPPTSPTPLAQTNITAYITQTGKYTVRLYASIVLSVWKSKTSTAGILWKNVGVYIRYGKYSPGTNAGWTCSVPFGKSATANGLLAFKYWANLTALTKQSADSYLVAWVGSTQYNIISFSSVANATWQAASVSVPSSQLQGNSSVTIKLGVYSGSALQILSGTYRGFYFDNATFFVQYAPSPKSIKLALYDNANAKTYLDNDTTPGSGSLTVKPSTPWTGSGSVVTFHFTNNGTNGNANYNVSTVKLNYASTLYAQRSSLTAYCSFTVHDDTTASWYCNYSTPSSVNGYQNYNASVYVPTDWIWNGTAVQAIQVVFAGSTVTNYIPASVNSTTWVIKIPASVFSASPGAHPLTISNSAPNYLGPSTLRTLLFTQYQGTTSWVNSTSFIPGNVVRLVGYIKNLTGSGLPPPNVQASTATVRIYNESGSGYKSNIWTVSPNKNGSFFVQLSPWSASNVTYMSSGVATAIHWRFEASWTNGYECASGIARFTTNSTSSRYKQTAPLTTPGSPYTATYFRGFTLYAVYKNLTNGVPISPTMGATLTWNWNGTIPNNTMQWNATAGEYYATINGQQAYQNHYAPQGIWIQINATSSSSSLYVNQTTKTLVYVRNDYTSGSAPGFSVPYTTYYWNTTVTTTVTYVDTDNGSSGISGATLMVNNTLPSSPIGTSGIRWKYTYQGNGAYQLTFYTNTTKTGLSTWSFTAELNKTHYQSASFNLNGFNIRDRYTTSTQPYYSVTMPWSFNATFYITYLDQDAGGAPVLGANWVCTWTKAYAVRSFSNGTYRFSLSVTGLAPNTYAFSITLYKSHWANITLTNLQVVIRPINTALSLSTGSLTMFWGQNESGQLIYKDLDHVPNVNISTASWGSVLAYNSQTGANWTTSLVYNIRLNSTYHSWSLTLNGSLPVGTYTLWIHFWVNADYVGQYLYPTLTINPITTNLVQTGGTLTVVWGDPGRIIIKYTDSVHNGKPIPGATITVVVDPLIQVLPPIDNGSGVYTIIFLTNGSFPSSYPFTIQILKTHYNTNTISGNLQINRISTVVIVPSSIAVTYGNPLSFTVFFEDLNHSVGVVSNPTYYVVEVSCNWTEGGVLATSLGNNGTYQFILDSTANGGGPFLVVVNAYAPPCYNQASQSFTITISDVQTTLTLHSTTSPSPWGDNIIVLVDFNRTGTSAYIQSATITTNWTLAYTYLMTATGQWQITLNATGLNEGTYPIMINANKQYYVNQTLITSLTIRRIATSVTASTSALTLPWGDNGTVGLTCIDFDHDLNITGMSITSNWTCASWLTIVSPGRYSLTLGSVGALYGSYLVVVNASELHYATEPIDITVTIRAIRTSVTASALSYTLPWGDNGTVVFTCIDIDHDLNITGMSITSNWNYTSWLTIVSPGRYTLTLGTIGALEGTYLMVVNASQLHYATQITDITITVRAIKTAIEISAPSQVIKGTPVVIKITYIDTDHNNTGISDANFTVTNGLEEVNSTYYSIQDLGSGQYKLTLNTSWVPDNKLPDTFNLTLNFGKSNYVTQVQVVSFKVVYGGISPVMMVYTGAGGGGAVVLVLLGYVMYRRAKKPFIIKKIEQSLKLISKGETPEPMEGIRVRTEIPLALLAPDLETLGVKFKKEEPKVEEKKDEESEKKKQEKNAKRGKKNKEAKPGEMKVIKIR